jgi:fucose permease
MTAQASQRRPDALIVGIAFASFIAVGFNAGILGVAWPSIRDTFGISLDAIGALFFASTIGALAISLSSGPLISKVGLGPLLTSGCIIGAVGYLGFALAPAWWVMILLGLITSVGTSSIIVGLNTFFAMGQSARLMSWLQACFGLGATLSPAVMARIINAGVSWRWGYALVLVTYAALALWYGSSLRRWRLAEQASAQTGASATTGRSAAAHAGPPAKVRARDTLRLPIMWLSMLLLFTTTGMESSAAQWPYTLFTEARSIDPAVAGLWVSLYWASMTVGRILFGIVVDRIGSVRLLRLTMGGAICGATLIWWNLGAGLSFLGLALAGFSLSPLFPVLTSNTPKRLGAEHAANGIGFQQAAVRLGLAAIPALAGVLAEAFGLEVIGLFLFAVSIVMFLLHEATLTQKIQRDTQ